MTTKIDFNLILITDSVSNKTLSSIIEKACCTGLKAIQIRDKHSNASDILNAAKCLRKITENYNAKLIINDRYDIALLANADGLHSPEGGIKPNQIKSNNKFITGRSVHSLQSAKQAEKDGYDYIIYGPVFRTPSKVTFGKPLGLDSLKEISNSVNIPVFAVGGINSNRALKCIEKGAYGVAVIRDLLLSDNIKKTLQNYKKALGSL